MNKKRRSIYLAILLTMLMAVATLMGGCASTEPASTEPDSSESGSAVPDSAEPETEEPEEKEADQEMSAADKAAMSERAMDNFLNKVQSGNYVMTVNNVMTTTVSSQDQITFDFTDDELYKDFVIMSVNNEVFQGFLTDDSVDTITYVKEGNALEAAKAKLPGYWLEDEVSEGNIYNVFYNDTENPLTFVSYNDGVKNQLRSLAGYGEIALRYMHEVYLTLDAEDPSEAHITVAVDDDEVARYYFDDIDIKVTFGGAKSDSRADAWMKDPAYPEARTGWTEGDIFVFNSVFLPGYGEQAIPYMPFGSYALYVDDEHFISDDAVYIRDPHATEQDIKDYIALLEQNGFEAYTEDGKTTYRRLLREETKCYSSISLEYDNGLNAVAKKAYDFPKFEGFDTINSEIEKLGFTKLPATEDLTGLTALDRKWEQTEAWLYFYDYNGVLYVTAGYEDYDKAMAYLDAYVEALKADGYVPHVDSGSDEPAYYELPDQSANFRYHFDEDGKTVILLYKVEKLLNAAEAKDILTKGGFPDIDFTKYLSGRNTIKFQKIMYGKDYDPSVSLVWQFDTAGEGEAFLDKLTADLDKDGYYMVPASKLGSNKARGYINEEKGMGVAFDYFPGEGDAKTSIYFDFRGGIDFEAENESQNEEDGGSKPILGWKYANESPETLASSGLF